jgi:uncharacterized repeat protein (TIGR03803 family)
MRPTLDTTRHLGRPKTVFAIFLFWATTTIPVHAQTFTTLFSFDGTDGSSPLGTMVQATSGNLYGTTALGGNTPSPTNCPNGCGTIFEITSSGKFSTLYAFCAELNSDGFCPDGNIPIGGLVQATNGMLYGTTTGGGANDNGTFFEITPSGKLTTLYSFCSLSNCSDGAVPEGTLTQGTSGNFYGTTFFDGATFYGTVFEITPAGKLTTLYNFCSKSDCTDGMFPGYGVIQGSDGSFYGTTDDGGANDDGTVFRVTSRGAFTTLYSFCSQANCVDGSGPSTPLLQAANGDFYGATGGGTNGYGLIYSITAGGTIATAYSFCQLASCGDGSYPKALVEGTDGSFYGATYGDGESNYGTVFSLTSTGELTTLHTFDDRDGAGPDSGIVQATNGSFYGATYGGGNLTNCTDGCGTLYSVSVGLGPFVKTLTTSGKAGATVIILGSSLAGTTRVTFNGTAATFTVVSASEIKTTVPSTATTGFVEVSTPGGTLKSNTRFRVNP